MVHAWSGVYDYPVLAAATRAASQRLTAYFTRRMSGVRISRRPSLAACSGQSAKARQCPQGCPSDLAKKRACSDGRLKGERYAKRKGRTLREAGVPLVEH